MTPEALGWAYHQAVVIQRDNARALGLPNHPGGEYGPPRPLSEAGPDAMRLIGLKVVRGKKGGQRGG